MTWLAQHLDQCNLTEEVEGYLYGRAAKAETIETMGLVTWQPMDRPSPDGSEKGFNKRYSERGERLTGRLICPLHSPRGQVIGFHARNIDEKRDTRYLLPEAAWNPVWQGLRDSMAHIWAGGDVWLVEGLFDKFPLEWVVPLADAVLACGRANLSRQQLEFLCRFCQGWVHVVYDNDETGQQGMRGRVDENGKRWPGVLERMDKVGLRNRPVPYRGGKDPGVIWDHGGLAGLQAAFPQL